MRRVWLGTWSLGGEGWGKQDAGESRRVLERAFAAGLRHVDTAGFYAHGKSERLVGQVLRAERTKLFISTKGGLEWRGRSVVHDGSPAALRRALVESLERLGTDYVDLYQLHWPDPRVPLAESVGALEELTGEGLARFWGVGNLDAKEVSLVLRPQGHVPHQVHFSPVHRSFSVLEHGEKDGRAFHCATSPLEQGLLGSGRGARGLPALGARDVRRRNPLFRDPEVLRWVEEFHRLAATSQIPRVALVLLWILGHPQIDVVVPGPRSVSQLTEVLAHRHWLEVLGLEPRALGGSGDWRPALMGAAGRELWSVLEEGPTGASR